MNNKTKTRSLKVAIIAVALLLCLALAIGITGAFYQAKRQATGTLSMDQGIIIDYKGFDKTGDEWSKWERTATLPLFSITNAQPGEQIAVNAAGIRANEKSVNFYARVKLEYKFYNNGTEVTTLPNASDLITKSANFFGTNWVDGGSSDGYYYYATGSTLNKFAKTATTFVELFATDAKFVIEGEHFTGATSDGEGGGFKINDTTSINKIEVYLTLETLQGDVQTDELNTIGWKVTASSDDPTEDIEDFSKNKLLDSNGDEIDSNSTDLIEDTVYQVVDESGNGYKFTYKLDETNMTATITGPAGSPKQLDIPSKIRVNKKDYTIIKIGENAFYFCVSLTSITLSDSVTSIGNSTFSSCINLASITVSKGNTVYHSTGNCLIETVSKTLIAGCKTSIIPTDGSVTSIGRYAFYACSGLTSVTIPNSVISIGANAFSACSGLTSITLSDSVTSIGVNAFFGCRGLTSITIPDSIITIGNCAFQGCNSLTTTIGDIGGTWVKESDNTVVNADILLKNIMYNIKKA